MKLKFILLLGVFLYSFSPIKLNTVYATPHYDTAYDIINGVNAVRASYGLPALEVNNNLMSAAQGQSDYQASIGEGTHTGEGGTTPSDRAKLAGYGDGASISVSENIFSGSGATAVIAVSWWAGDPLHLQTMIGPYKHMGAGMAVKNGVTYFTLVTGYLIGDPGVGLEATPSAGGTGTAPIVLATPREDGSIVHVVGFGQTLWVIATQYGITVEELLTLNNLTESSVIYPGEELIIQLPIAGPTFTPSGPTFTPAPTTPTITPSPTIPPTGTPRPTRTLVPTEDNAVAQVITTTEPAASEPENVANSPSFQGMAQIFLVILLVVAGALVVVGNLFDRRKEKE